MLDGKDEHHWNHTASLIAGLRGALGDKAADPKKYHPHYNVKTMTHREAFRMLAAKHSTAPKKETKP